MLMAERRLVICKVKTKTSDATFATANIIITAKTVLWGRLKSPVRKRAAPVAATLTKNPNNKYRGYSR